MGNITKYLILLTTLLFSINCYAYDDEEEETNTATQQEITKPLVPVIQLDSIIKNVFYR